MCVSLSLPEGRVSEALEPVDRAGRSRAVALVAAGAGPAADAADAADADVDAADAADDDDEGRGLALAHHSQISQPAEI